MKRALAASSVGVILLLLTSCAPVIVRPSEMVTGLPFSEAFSAVVTTINTQPYPANMGGWVITEANRASGFIAAQMTYRICGFVPFTHHARVHCRTYDARVSVTLIERPDGRVVVGIGATNDSEARALAARITERLGLVDTWSAL
ncbi:MAG: hypothetical protein P8Y02_09440 [Deinococcales bacterium]